jgi:hypothetical protein
MEITELIDAAARAAVEHQPGDLPDHLAPGSDARLYVWDRHYAGPSERRRLDEKLAAATPEFQKQVAAVEQHLADELADDNIRLANVRASNPELYKD